MNYETVESEMATQKEGKKMNNEEKIGSIRTNEFRQRDKYDDAIDYLTEHPKQIEYAWGDPEEYEGRGGELFGFVGPDWKSNDNTVRYEGQHGTCGCLQQIRAAKVVNECDTMVEALRTEGQMVGSYWPRLWEKIAGDRRLPHEPSDITVEDLPVFAEWQREIDILRKSL